MFITVAVDHKYVRLSVVKTAVDWITNGQKSIRNSFPLFFLVHSVWPHDNFEEEFYPRTQFCPHTGPLPVHVCMYVRKCACVWFSLGTATVFKTWISINAFWWDCLSGGTRCETTLHIQQYTLPWCALSRFPCVFTLENNDCREHTFYFGP